MTYKTRLNIAKIISALAALLVVAPMAMGAAPDRAQIFWLISLPVLAHLLWGGLHGTGRSVRTVGYLGLAYTISLAFSSSPAGQTLYWVLLVLFALGILISIRRRSEQSE